MIGKGYRLKLAKEKGTRGKLQEKPGTSFQVSPVNGVTWGFIHSSQQ